jgi:hypothetical protein
LGGEHKSPELPDIVDVLRSKEAAGNVHLIIVAAEQKIGTEIEVLLAAVAGDLGGNVARRTRQVSSSSCQDSTSST